MYENEIYSGNNAGGDTNGGREAVSVYDSSVNCGTTGNNTANTARTEYRASEGNSTANAGNPYFDYTASRTEDLNQQGFQSRQAEKERKKKEKKAMRAERKRNKQGSTFKKIALSGGLGLCFGLFAGLGFYAIQLGAGQLDHSADADVEKITESLQEPGDKESAIPAAGPVNITYVSDDISDVVDEVMPAMVSIVNSYTKTGTNFWGQSYSMPGEGSGSGIIVAENDDELLIVSNNHVVESANELEVTFIDGTTAKARIKGLDSDMDLAVVAVSLSDLSEETKNAITVASLGDSDHLKLGQPVIAIGNALGYGQSVTNGIVSALNREITLEDGSVGTFIQTNAAINPGNSGGALLNINGEVIGINSNKIGGEAVEGMGYAIPIRSASPIISDLMERQTRDKVAEDEIGYMGITMQEIPDQVVQMYNMPQGVFVYEVEPGSAAEAAGIKKGDVVVKLDGQRVTTSTDLQNAMQYYKAGETITITVKRAAAGEYESIDLEITLGSRPE